MKHFFVNYRLILCYITIYREARMKKTEYTIGQINKILNVSIQAIRHYQALGLIQPSRIDSKTNYRYFDHSILSDIYHIKVLQSEGFSLEDMRNLRASSLDQHRSI